MIASHKPAKWYSVGSGLSQGNRNDAHGEVNGNLGSENEDTDMRALSFNLTQFACFLLS